MADLSASGGPHQRSFVLDRLLGALNAAATLAAAVLLSLGLRDLVTAAPLRAVWLIAAGVALRGAVATGTGAIVASQERRSRAWWHQRAAHHLAHSSPDELHELDVAIDNLSAVPALTVTESAAISSLAALGMLWYFGGVLSALVVLALLALSVPAYVRVGRQSEATMTEFHRRRGALVARQLALLRSITDLRALGAVAFGADGIAAQSRAEAEAVLSGVRVTIRSTLVTEFLGGVSVGLVAMIVGLRLWHHSIHLFAALAAVLVTAEMFAWLRRFGAQFHRRDDAAAATRRLAAWRDERPRVTAAHLLAVCDLRTAAPSGEITFEVRRGERVRVSGPSGVGKSSLIDTALGMREPLGGSTELVARVGLIRTDAHFLDGTLRENVNLLGDASDDQCAEVLTELGFRRGRDLDLTVELGENGRSLSTGERVTLAVARALLVGVELLVLDDVAGSLDQWTLGQLRAALAARGDLAVLEATPDVGVLQQVDREYTLVAR